MNVMQNQYIMNINEMNTNNQGFPNPNSAANLNFNEKKPKKKKKGKKKGFKRKDEVNVQDNSFNIYKLGDVELAERHGSANQPLKGLKKLDDKVNFCPCCGLPSKTQGYLEEYKTCDNPDDFSNCGLGVSLYYSFIKFVILVLVVCCICVSCFNIYFSYKYTQELNTVCNNYYKSGYSTNKDYINECKFYFTEVDDDIFNDTRIDSFFFQFSSCNVKDYRDLYNKMSSEKSDSFESSVINLSRINFFCLFLTFIFNLVYIYFLFNKSNAADYLNFTVSDYSIFLYNLYDIHLKFLNNIEEINKKREEYQRLGKQFIEELEFKSKMGFIPTQGMSEIELFKRFITDKVCKGKFGEDFKIYSVDLCYKLEELMKLQEKLELKNEKIIKVENDPEQIKKNEEEGLEGDNRKYFGGFCKKDEDLGKIREEKDKIQNEIDSIIVNSKQNTLQYFGGAAFITFESIKEQELYLKNLPNNSIEYFFKFMRNLCYMLCSCCMNKSKENIYYLKRNVKFEMAPEPEDVIFENLEIKPINRIMRTFFVYFLSILMCAVSFVIIVALNKLQKFVDDKNNSNQELFLYIISLAITGVTTGIDFILEIILEFLTKKERQTTMTDYYLSYSVKLTLFQFLNSAVLPLVSELAIDKSEGHEILISNMLMKFLVNAFVTPMLWTMNFGYFFKKFRIYLINKNVQRDQNGKIINQDKEKIGKTQKELNELYELPKMNVSAKYSYIGKTLLMSFLYIPIFPLGLIISLLGFCLGYWLEKFNFANMYKKPEMLNRQLVEFYVNYFILIFFAYGVGDYLFLSEVYESRTWSLVNIIVFGILIIIPYHRILSREYFDVEESQLNKMKYEEAYLTFNTDYERSNPMTKREGTLKYLNELKNQGLIDNQTYQKQLQDINNANLMDLYYKQRTNGRFTGGFNNYNGFNGGFHRPWGNMYPGTGFIPHQTPNYQVGNNIPVNQVYNAQNNIYSSQFSGQNLQINQSLNNGYPPINNNLMNPQMNNAYTPRSNDSIMNNDYPPTNINFSPQGSNNVNIYNSNPYPNNYTYQPNNYQGGNMGYGSY